MFWICELIINNKSFISPPERRALDDGSNRPQLRRLPPFADDVESPETQMDTPTPTLSMVEDTGAVYGWPTETTPGSDDKTALNDPYLTNTDQNDGIPQDIKDETIKDEKDGIPQDIKDETIKDEKDGIPQDTKDETIKDEKDGIPQDIKNETIKDEKDGIPPNIKNETIKDKEDEIKDEKIKDEKDGILPDINNETINDKKEKAIKEDKGGSAENGQKTDVPQNGKDDKKIHKPGKHGIAKSAAKRKNVKKHFTKNTRKGSKEKDDDLESCESSTTLVLGEPVPPKKKRVAPKSSAAKGRVKQRGNGKKTKQTEEERRRVHRECSKRWHDKYKSKGVLKDENVKDVKERKTKNKGIPKDWLEWVVL